MESLPGMWRTELWHPLSVHFPIALLIFATLFILIARLVPVKWKDKFSVTGLFMLIPGVILAWWAVYSGTLADSVVGRYVCDPTVLEDHERFAYISAYLFSGAALLEIGIRIKAMLRSDKIKRYLSILSLVVLLAGAASMSYVGHLGAKLVYQQAAGVHQPSEDCAEFE
ncbi:MAG: hypothetical protein K9J27_05745 [Bacteroidales bacterium]|nr:hypothetical protein [Bacteroidales bacterium]